MLTLSASSAPGSITTTPTVTPQPCPPGSTLTSRGCLRAGSFVPGLTTNTPQPSRPPLCPAWMIATSVGCLYPAGAITAFDARRGKWRVAVTFEALRPPPLPAPQPRPSQQLTPMGPMTPSSTLTPMAAMTATRSGFGDMYMQWPRRPSSWSFGQAATHQSVAEADAPPQGVKQVDIATFTIAIGEPVPQQPTPPAPLPLPTPTPTSTSPTPTTTPPRMDVGPTTVPPSGSPPFVPPQFPGSEFPGSQFPVSTRPRYTGCIARFNKSRRVYSIYCPIGTSPGLGIASDDFRCLFGNCNGLGQEAVTPAVPTGFVKTAETATLPGAGETVAGEERDNFFRANNPAMWIAIVGTAAAVGGGGYWLIRRRRRAA